MKKIKPTSSSQYDAEQVARFFDAYGIREWNRLVQGPAQEVSLYIHTHYLEHYVAKPNRWCLPTSVHNAAP
jgi:hypothetical protein